MSSAPLIQIEPRGADPDKLNYGVGELQEQWRIGVTYGPMDYGPMFHVSMFPVTIDNRPQSHCLIPISYWHWEHGNMNHWIIGPLAIGSIGVQLLSAFEVPAPEGDGER